MKVNSKPNEKKSKGHKENIKKCMKDRYLKRHEKKADQIKDNMDIEEHFTLLQNTNYKFRTIKFVKEKTDLRT